MSTKVDCKSAAKSQSGWKCGSSVVKEEASLQARAPLFWPRLLLLAVLFGAVVAVSLSLYYITTEAEDDEFQGQFDADATHILKSFEEITMTKFEALSSLGITFTAQARVRTRRGPLLR
jgi:hypothetical protein